MKRTVDMRQVQAFLAIHGAAIGQIAANGSQEAQNLAASYELWMAERGVAHELLLLDCLRWFLNANPWYAQFFMRDTGRTQ